MAAYLPGYQGLAKSHTERSSSLDRPLPVPQQSRGNGATEPRFNVAQYLFRDIASVAVMMATKDFLFGQPALGVVDE